MLTNRITSMIMVAVAALAVALGLGAMASGCAAGQDRLHEANRVTHAGPCEPAWSVVGDGMNSWVEALTVFDDGAGPALYAAGNFSVAGGVPVHYIAKWDGEAWSALDSGMSGASPRYFWTVVYALTVFDDGAGPALYAAGDFITAGGVEVNHIAKWDGEAWSALGSGMGGSDNIQVHALTVFDDGAGPALYAGGLFPTAGGVEVNNVARWDGEAWSALGGGMGGSDNTKVHALTVFDDGAGPALYAGGLFPTAGAVEVDGFAKWDGEAWSALGGGMSGSLSALTVFDDGAGPTLYAGGGFSTIDGVEVNRIARWDGAAWSPLWGRGGRGVNGQVLSLTVFEGGARPALYVGGRFTTAGGIEANNIAKWDGEGWSALDDGVNNPVHALTMFDDGAGPALHAGGYFNTAGSVGASFIAKWSCATEPLRDDVNGADAQ